MPLSPNSFFVIPCDLCSFAVMNPDEKFMFRCLELAQKGAGSVAPNPLVGAVLVHQDRVIGEGYHQVYGGPHAEVNCLSSVKEIDRPLIATSRLYVSLEPCVHHGKTPPCADLIIRERIPEVIIGCRDPFPLVNGKGIEKLTEAGVSVRSGILEEEAKKINKRFFTFHQHRRPFILLKWAQSADGKIAGHGKTRIQLSNPYTNRLVHSWRAQESAILVGTETVLKDNPFLTSRIPGAKNPVRLIIDRMLRIPEGMHIFNDEAKTIIFNVLKEEKNGDIYFCKLRDEKNLLPEILQKLVEFNIQSVLVEGGTYLLNTFLHEGLWDEIRLITSTEQDLPDGYSGPAIPGGLNFKTIMQDTDRIDYFSN